MPFRRKLRIAAWIMAGVLAIFMMLVAWLAITAPLSRSLKPIAPPSITLVSEDGQIIARKGAIIDKPVAIADLPKQVPDAFIAIEDRRFYSHWGIDPRGIARALWRNMWAGGTKEGGSTITQQLAKGVFLNNDRTAGRKLREAMIAFWLEAWLTKDQILERYLSNVYFGDNVYGLRAAAMHYFNRRPEKLTVAQAAMLAGLLKAPSRLAPTTNLEGARDRAKLVVHAMAEAGFITEAQEKATKPAVLDVTEAPESTSGTYFADWVLPEARDRAGAVYGAQNVVTTMDAKIQKIAEGAARRAPLGKAQVAMVTMKPDGSVVAMIGGKSYKDSAFNRAVQARRQPGSTFKLFVYLAAFRAGMTPDDMIDDTPITEGDYRPSNHDGRYRGRITLRQAFAVSSNVAAVRLAQKVGVRAVIRAARDLGVTSPLGEDPSLALGTSEITLLELTQAYAAIAAGAYPVTAHGLPPEEQGWLAKLMERQKNFSDDQLKMIRDLLSSAANRGTGSAAALRTSTFGKTGTTQDNRDALFVGYAGGLVTAVWVGNDDNTPLPGIAGGGIPARIWRDFTARAIGEPSEEATPAERDEDLVNAIANVSVETGIGNLNVGIGPDGINIGLEPSQSPATPPVPTPAPQPRITPPQPVEANP
jgi:penicillin-binding protein 1A